jgi:membrane peptidoglycan carboxypeptidase
MLAVGSITPREHDRAARAPMPDPDSVRLPGTEITWRAPYFTNYVKSQLIERRGARNVFGAGLRVTTTIDLKLQEMARQAIAKWLPDADDPEAALVVLDAETGDVLAMVGGRNYRASQFNLAVQSERQPGSSFKPFVLATALQQGIAPATTFESKPLSVFLGDKYVSIGNYEDSYLGVADLTTATIHSDNSVYTQLTQLVGPKRVARTAKELGVTSPLNGYLSIGLGAEAVNPLELARAYLAFANGGYRIDQRANGAAANRPRVIAEIRNAEGDTIDANLQTSHQFLSRRTTTTVNDILQRVVTEGTGERAALSRWAVAGKTGTTENYGDAWFVGYTPEVVTAVWVGYPDTLRPMLTEFHGDPVAGGTYPAQVWKTFMERALPYLEAKETDGEFTRDFAPPEYASYAPQMVVERDGVLQRDNGVCRDPREIVYFADAGPRRTADCKPNEVDVPRVIDMTLGEARDRLAQQPLTAKVVYKWARPLQRTDVVLDQEPRRGRLSSFDEVTLVLGKPRHGLIPDVHGITLGQARRLLSTRKLRGTVSRFGDGPPGRVLSQSPPPGVAAAPGMTVRLVVARGQSAAPAG